MPCHEMVRLARLEEPCLPQVVGLNWQFLLVASLSRAAELRSINKRSSLLHVIRIVSVGGGFYREEI